MSGKIPEARLPRGFAMPAPVPWQALDRAAARSVSRHLRAFLARPGIARWLEDRSHGLCAFLRRGARHAIGFDTAWDLSLGLLRRAAAGDSTAAPTLVAAAVALRLAEGGLPGRWSLALDRPASLRWAGWALPPAETIQVDSDGIRAGLGLTRGRREHVVELRRGAGMWTGVGANPLPALQAGRRRIYLVTPDHAGLWWRSGRGLSQAPASALLRSVEEALARLASHAPHYHRWVARVLRVLVPLPARPLRSGSHPDAPGVVELSLPLAPAPLGELLVHEAAHQYFGLAGLITALHDGSDRAAYFSPFRGRPRPIEAILLAYHAFANVALYHQACEASGAPDGAFWNRTRPGMLDALAACEDSLRRTRGLTAAGQALWRRPWARLAAATPEFGGRTHAWPGPVP